LAIAGDENQLDRATGGEAGLHFATKVNISKTQPGPPIGSLIGQINELAQWPGEATSSGRIKATDPEKGDFRRIRFLAGSNRANRAGLWGNPGGRKVTRGLDRRLTKGEILEGY